ncbi:hypothetical protein BDR26DRAFT_1007228 [Obelidium mucronatum]|nr:hypothetical protein BDR26DRAFT_1007228 [Obelidium mucronatum]
MRFREGDDGIERTPQYYDFMTQLQQFHETLGTLLQPEPILGGKKLDLYRIYLGVKAAGGFEKVSEEHGWQKIANPFEFPPTCTNSAYVIKRAYKSYIYNFAQVKDHGTPIEALRLLESTTRKLNEEANAGLGKKGKAKPQDVTPVMTAFVAPQRGNGAPIRVEEYARDDKYLVGGYQNKLLLALLSGLPNEVDWAFNKLVRLSSTAPPNFHLGSIPSLLDALLSHTDAFFDILKLNTAADNFETSPDHTRPSTLLVNLPHYSELTLFNSKESAELMERVLQLMHILRNFSFSDINLKFFISQHLVLTVVAKALALPPYSVYTALKHHALDIFENLAGYITLRGRNDFYLACIRKIIMESTDRGLLIGSLRALARLCGTDANQSCLCDLESGVLERVFQLLRVAGDDELVYVVLEFLYMFSCLGADAVAKIVAGGRASGGDNIVGVMVGYLRLNTYGRGGFAAGGKRVGNGMKKKVVPKVASQQVVQPQAVANTNAGAQGQPAQTAEQQQQQVQQQKQQAAAANSTPVKGSANASNVNSVVPSPAVSKAVTPLKQTPNVAVTPAPATPTKKAHVNDDDDEEDEEIDIDGDDDDDYQAPVPASKAKAQQQAQNAAFKPAPASQTPGMTASAPAGASLTSMPSFLDVINNANAGKKRGRPPKYKAEIDAYSNQLAQQMQQQQTLLFQQNPNMSLQEQQNLMMQFQQQHAAMVTSFSAQMNVTGGGAANSAAPSNASAPTSSMMMPSGGGGIVANGGFGGSSGFGYGSGVPVAGLYVPEEEEEEEEEEEIASEPSFECHWRDLTGKECPLAFGTEKEIVKHLMEAHFSQQQQSYVCRWSSCQAFHNGTGGTRVAVFRHAQTHLGDYSKKPTPRALAAAASMKAFRSGGLDSPDLIGIPLTALLVLRNLARTQKTRDLFLPFEAQLATAVAERPKLSKPLAELLFELR